VLSEFAPAKINLTLQVSGPIPDGEAFSGYHRLGSLVAFARDVGDQLQLEPSDTLSLSIEGPFAADLGGDQHNNLVLRAARALQTAAKIDVGAAITLHKALPVASGIGGGSSDAAAALRGLVRLWRLEPTGLDLAGIAATLGADVPACLDPKSLWMSGIGTDVSAKPLPELYALLVNPGVACPTATVYARFDAMLASGELTVGDVATIPTLNPSALKSAINFKGNSLHAPAIALLPEIGLILDVLTSQRGVHAAAMSGSGATCFGLFETIEHASKAASNIKAMLSDALPGLWCATTRL
jgi:4-diphosphocytidyl-2-C-methyl-D-erythritol kinase